MLNGRSIYLSIIPLELYVIATVTEEIVITSPSGKDVTTSLIIAEVFGKEHYNVLRDIESLECSREFNALNFEVISYTDSQNRTQRAYEITKDGFSFLVMGYTGVKAAEFKELFINEFNKRDAMLRKLASWPHL